MSNVPHAHCASALMKRWWNQSSIHSIPLYVYSLIFPLIHPLNCFHRILLTHNSLMGLTLGDMKHFSLSFFIDISSITYTSMSKKSRFPRPALFSGLFGGHNSSISMSQYFLQSLKSIYCLLSYVYVCKICT